jgi:hypothetical protein
MSPPKTTDSRPAAQPVETRVKHAEPGDAQSQRPTPEQNCLRILGELSGAPMIKNVLLPRHPLQLDAVLDLRGQSAHPLPFGPVNELTMGRLVCFEHISRGLSEHAITKMLGKAALARGGRRGATANWEQVEVDEPVVLFILCERLDQASKVRLADWTDPVTPGIRVKQVNWLTIVGVVLNELPVTPQNVPLHLLGQITSRKKLLNLAEHLRSNTELDNEQKTYSMEILMKAELMMNTQTGQSRTPMLDAAMRKGREEGRLNAFCETARCLGATQQLVDQWVALGPAKGSEAAMDWVAQFATKAH